MGFILKFIRHEKDMEDFRTLYKLGIRKISLAVVDIDVLDQGETGHRRMNQIAIPTFEMVVAEIPKCSTGHEDRKKWTHICYTGISSPET